MTEPTAEAADPAEDRCPRCGHAVGDAWLVCANCGRQIAAPAELEVGSGLADDRYEVLRVIGRGGFGITYEVGDRRLQRRVAVKELFPDSAVRHGSLVLTPPQGRPGFAAARGRFLREARVLARFTHPGIVRVYEVFEEHGTAYLVMELLDGTTLIDLLRARGHPFAEAEVLDVAGRVAAALRPVHVAGVLHRDVNPSNVMMTEHGRIVVIDFGLARDYEEDRTVGMTRMVTPGYAPLEQYRGEGRFGPSTDVYGLAATLYRLATGRVPVSAVERDAGAALPSVRKLNPAISRGVSDAILDGLELEPGHRPQDLDAFLARLGVARLPEGPRSLLLDADAPTAVPARSWRPAPARRVEHAPAEAIPAPAPGRPTDAVGLAGAGALAAPDLDEDRTAATELVARGPAGGQRSVPVGSDGRDDHTVLDREVGRREVDATRGADPFPELDGGATRLDGFRAYGPTHGLAPPPPPPPVLPRPVLSQGPMTAAAGIPGSDRRHPVAVGPHRPGRPKVTIPMALLAVACAMAAPVLVTAVVVLVALPALATFGDSSAHRLRSEHGIVGGWAERRLSPGFMAPVRFARNLFMSVLRASPLIGVGAVLLGAWYGLARTSVGPGVVDVALRAVGGGTVAAIVASAREGSSRFRTGLGLDELIRRVVPDGRTTERVAVGWLVTALIVSAALWLAPDPFPLPRP